MTAFVSPPSFSKNILANFVGRGWTGVVSLVFVPVYIKFLGIEAYGLIGIYTSLLALLAVLDMGLSSTLNRELARLSALTDSAKEARDLTRTMEIIYWGIGLLVGIAFVAASSLIALHWVHATEIPPEIIRKAVILMGCVAMFEWPTAIYTGGMMGIQQQVRVNVIRAAVATLQAGGAALLLWLVSPTILAYFAWQVLMSAVQVLLLSRSLWSFLPRAGKEAASFSRDLLKKHWRFAAGVTGITLMSTVLTQIDKVILSRFLSLEAFGYYILAFNVANMLGTLVQPVFSGLFPVFARLAADHDDIEAASLYHKGTQLLSIIVLPIGMTLTFFSRELLTIWISTPATVENTHFLLSLIVIGTILNSIMIMPFMLQLANGWTQLSFIKNVIAVAIFFPLLSLMIIQFGAMGGALAWILLNGGYLLIEVPVMHRKLLKNEMNPWYIKDVAVPAVLTILVFSTSKIIIYPLLSNIAIMYLPFVTLAVSFSVLAFYSPSYKTILNNIFGVVKLTK